MFTIRLAAILLVFLSLLAFHPTPSRTSIENRAGSSFEEPLPDFPPGATVIFDEPASTVAITDVFLKRIDAVAKEAVWTVPAQKLAESIGFVVPQLPRGAYEAWYESKADSTKLSSMKFTIVPRLLAEDGIVRSEPGNEVEVRVKIPQPEVAKKSGAMDELNVLASLKIGEPGVAEVIGDSSKKIGKDGSVVWKVRITGSGIAEVEARADSFEPAVINVVGMPGPGDTFEEAQLALLEKEVKVHEQAVATAQERVKRLDEEIERMEGPARPSKSTGKYQREIEQLEARKVTAVEDLERLRKKNSETRLTLGSVRVDPLPLMNENELKPGDVLLVLGSSPIISEAIRRFDGEQLGINAEYSHVSLYVGDINGKRMVAEMWASGYWITPLGVSTKGARLVDVYRRNGVDDNKRNQIAERGKTIFGNPQNFVRGSSPWFFSRGSGLPYAFEEIAVLGMAALNRPASTLQDFVAGKVDPRAGGRRKMICSELVAWVYQDVGLPLNVQYWRSLSDAHIFTTSDRKLDYTTPNMIARSGDLSQVGSYIRP